jgi:CelD/BcsL family acetyltransferase involved in cellulose biosynthesis
VGPSEVRTRPEELEDLVDGWRRLAAATPGGSYFLSPDWVLGWWETLGAGTAAEVAVWRGPSGALEAVVPLARSRQRLHRRLPLGVRAWTNLGGGPGAADHCGWPATAARATDVAGWIAAKAARAPLLLRGLDPETGAPLVPEGARGSPPRPVRAWTSRPTASRPPGRPTSAGSYGPTPASWRPAT